MDNEVISLIELPGLLPAGAALTKLATGATWSEGPVYLPQRNSVRWSDIPGNRILEYSIDDRELSVYRDGVEFTNGRTLDRDGSTVQCSHGRRAIERDVDGVVTVLVDRYRGARLNSPNDVIIDDDGSIWFTDPPYGITVAAEGHPGDAEYRDHFVFRFDPVTGDLHPVVTDVEEPNGLAFSPDRSTLYVSDTSVLSEPWWGKGNHHIRAYDVVGNRCKNGRTFVTIDEGVSDGFRVDTEGRVWTSTLTGVRIYSPEGDEVGRFPVPEKVGNLCFGGPDGTDLFIAATTSLYTVPTLTRSAADWSVRPTREVVHS
ncbi:SMP-30/gluconolactonase/LRE family protein [Galbitalea sp. SE-J8]|uniref:SMP-30/gluconolactonase/LRE family protein n=1 Tax=Galbitalea sp. SE-J8 TaxID=3054952 RepID=UPI00259D1593|nr:SMP-30/gluconolactonase/LRE family protein [Galbitalea sp. SE-J8]MDM4763008.1 SMP-30/gluconolactonase/LRE family protein [Galbitalea sp. SE-J8]